MSESSNSKPAPASPPEPVSALPPPISVTAVEDADASAGSESLNPNSAFFHLLTLPDALAVVEPLSSALKASSAPEEEQEAAQKEDPINAAIVSESPLPSPVAQELPSPAPAPASPPRTAAALTVAPASPPRTAAALTVVSTAALATPPATAPTTIKVAGSVASGSGSSAVGEASELPSPAPAPASPPRKAAALTVVSAAALATPPATAPTTIKVAGSVASGSGSSAVGEASAAALSPFGSSATGSSVVTGLATCLVTPRVLRTLPGGWSALKWLPDDASSTCGECTVKFGALTRRHHCRACGGAYCDSCSAARLPLAHFPSKVLHALRLFPSDFVRNCKTCAAPTVFAHSTIGGAGGRLRIDGANFAAISGHRVVVELSVIAEVVATARSAPRPVRARSTAVEVDFTRLSCDIPAQVQGVSGLTLRVIVENRASAPFTITYGEIDGDALDLDENASDGSLTRNGSGSWPPDAKAFSTPIASAPVSPFITGGGGVGAPQSPSLNATLLKAARGISSSGSGGGAPPSPSLNATVKATSGVTRGTSSSILHAPLPPPLPLPPPPPPPLHTLTHSRCLQH